MRSWTSERRFRGALAAADGAGADGAQASQRVDPGAGTAGVVGLVAADEEGGEVVARAGISRKVAQLRAIGVIPG